MKNGFTLFKQEAVSNSAITIHCRKRHLTKNGKMDLSQNSRYLSIFERVRISKCQMAEFRKTE